MMDEQDDRIKSAFEKAMERVEKLEPPPREKQLEWKGVPEGNRLAAEHLRGEVDLGAAVEKHSAEERPYVLRGAIDVLTANIHLPRDDAALRSNDRALDGLRSIFRDKPQVEEIVGRVKYVIEQYVSYGQQQQQQMYEQLKQQFTAQVQEALRQQPGLANNASINVESLPEFQQERLRMKVRLDQQYEEHLETYRQEFKSLVG